MLKQSLTNCAPTPPQNVLLENAVLIWNESTDNIGIAYYIVYDNGKAVARVEATENLSFSIMNAEHSYTVAAVDGAGNMSTAVEANS